MYSIATKCNASFYDSAGNVMHIAHRLLSSLSDSVMCGLLASSNTSTCIRAYLPTYLPTYPGDRLI